MAYGFIEQEDIDLDNNKKWADIDLEKNVLIRYWFRQNKKDKYLLMF